MDVREKLVELLSADICKYNYCEDCEYFKNEDDCYAYIKDNMADYLITNGVKVQEWISVEDKLPPYNRDVLVYRPNMAMKFVVDTYDGYYGDDDDEWNEGWALYGKDTHGNPVITHWAYLPQPPKGE